MLVLPIVNRDRIVNVEVKLKTAVKVRNKVRYEDIEPSDVIVNNSAFSLSSYNAKNIDSAIITDFIRNNSIMAKNDFFVSTKESNDSNLYDIYQVMLPPDKINTALDRLYGNMILDLKNSIPSNSKGRYLDFEKLGIVEPITNDKLEKLAFIASNIDESEYSKAVMENDLGSLIDTLRFLDLFDCRVIEGSAVKTEIFEKVLKSINTTNSKDSKALNNYYNIALSNKKAYSIISRLYNIVYNDSLNWIHGKDKVKIKTNDEIKGVI